MSFENAVVEEMKGIKKELQGIRGALEQIAETMPQRLIQENICVVGSMPLQMKKAHEAQMLNDYAGGLRKDLMEQGYDPESGLGREIMNQFQFSFELHDRVKALEGKKMDRTMVSEKPTKATLTVEQKQETLNAFVHAIALEAQNGAAPGLAETASALMNFDNYCRATPSSTV